ncbi:hypothetical protein LRS10_13840 [Phenylobacterium sp. J426]|uniref:hypothetical protein n=1 Tax=Phenylobacterium sp. J426 TaxID=2898439 RepID=UPI0021513C4B|nr:hypothetical protein [Phenylobacterium sp. J426]MCR5875175.1 hypothetical protein [Phenylobacterium sp. J426]
MAAAANTRLAAAGLTASASAARFSTAVTGAAVATRMATGVAGGLVGLLGGPWGVAFTAAATSVWLVHKALVAMDQPSKEIVKTTTALSAATDAYAEAAQTAALASGKEREEAIKNAAAKKAQAEENIKSAQAKIADARATLAQIEAENRRAIEAERFSARGDAAGTIRPTINTPAVMRAKADIEATRAAIEAAQKSIESSDRILKAGSSAVKELSEKELKELEKAAKAAAKAREKAAKEAKKDSEKRLADAREVIDDLLNEEERYAKSFAETMAKLDAAREGGEISAEEYTDAILRMLSKIRQESVKAADDLEKVDFTVVFGTAKEWNEGVKNIDGVKEQLDSLLQSLDDVIFGFQQLRYSLSRGDWSGALQGLLGTIGGIRGAFASGGMGGGISAIGTVAGQVIGGRTGQAIGGGLGLAGLGMGIGGMLSSGAAAGTIGTLLGGGVLGAGVANGIMAIAGLAGPIGIAAGALYAAAKLFNIGGKPSNAGAGLDLRTGALSGNKRTSETEQAAKAAGDAILEAQKTFEAAGIKLGDTITGLVIGTRDLTQVYTASGRTLTSAVGDAAAATDAAVKAMLDGANFASEAQEKLVRSMLAAGKGFDEIAASLQAYQVAQGLGQSIADEILRLTEPRKYDIQQVERAAEAQRKAVEEAVKAGYLTAEQSLDVLEKLAQLTGLQLAEVEKQYGQTSSAADIANRKRELEIALMEASGDAAGALAARRADELAALRAIDPVLADLRARYFALTDVAAAQAEVDRIVEAQRQKQRQELQETVSRLKALTGSLRDFRKELFLGSSAMLTPQQQYAAAKVEFERTATLAKARDRDAMERLQSVSEAYLKAAEEVAPTAEAYGRDLQAVRAAVASTETIATNELNAAEAALATLENISSGVDELVLAMNNLAAAFAKLEALPPGAAGGIDVARYLANNPDLKANWEAGGVMRELGATLEEAAREHYARTGKSEIAAGLRHYARGGFHPGGLRLVGEEGAEIEATGPARYYSAAETSRMLKGGSAGADLSRAADLVVTALGPHLNQMLINSNRLYRLLDGWDGEGLPEERDAA